MIRYFFYTSFILIYFLSDVLCQDEKEKMRLNCSVCHANGIGATWAENGFVDFKNIYYGVSKEEFDKRMSWLLFGKKKNEEDEIHLLTKKHLGEETFNKFMENIYIENSKEKYKPKKEDEKKISQSICFSCHGDIGLNNKSFDVNFKKMLDKYGIKEKQKIPPEVYFDVIKKCAEVDKKNNTATLRTSQDDTNYQASIYIFLNKKNGFDLNLDDGKYPLLIIENPEVFFEKLKANEKKDKELKVGDDIPVLDNTKEKNDIKKKDQK